MQKDWRPTRAQTVIWAIILVSVFAVGVFLALSGAGLLEASGTTEYRIGLLLMPIGITFGSFALLMTGMIIRQQRRTNSRAS